jgi:hypothetical protein
MYVYSSPHDFITSLLTVRFATKNLTEERGCAAKGNLAQVINI